MKTREQIAGELLECLLSHDAAVCIVGNVTVREIARLLLDMFTSCPACGAEPWVNIDCRVCDVMYQMDADEKSTEL